MEISVTFMAQVPVALTQREKWFLASCPILDVHSQGETEEEAKANLGDALSLFFISCFERGTLDAVLKQCGFKPATPPAKHEKLEGYIEVPIPFVVDTDLSECHVA